MSLEQELAAQRARAYRVATYVVGMDGIVRFACVDADYTKRAEPDAILAALAGKAAREAAL